MTGSERLALAVAAVGLVCTWDALWAHEAASGWSYDAVCCSNRDCAPISPEWVEITAEGYRVTVPAGHETATRDHVEVFGWGEVRKSGDEHYHACITPHMQRFLCLYVPEFGS